MADADCNGAQMSVVHKTCTKCGEAKPASADHFYRCKTKSSGFQSSCKTCMEEHKRAKRLKDNASFHEKRQAAHGLAAEGLRKCNVCHQQKALGEFQKHPNTVGGVTARCKDCIKELKARRERELHPDRVSARMEKKAIAARGMRQCRVCCEIKPATEDRFYFDRGSPQGICKSCRKADEQRRRSLNPERFKAQLKDWYRKNKEYVAAKNQEYRAKNRESLIAASKAYYRKDPKRHIASSLRWRSEQRKVNPVFALQERMRSAIGYAFRDRGYTKRSKTHEILGCDWEFFKLHIERQFLKGMTWENKGDWHIDHIQPMASAKTEADVLALSHYTNLRPLWAADNFAKSDEVTHLI